MRNTSKVAKRLALLKLRRGRNMRTMERHERLELKRQIMAKANPGRHTGEPVVQNGPRTKDQARSVLVLTAMDQLSAKLQADAQSNNAMAKPKKPAKIFSMPTVQQVAPAPYKYGSNLHQDETLDHVARQRLRWDKPECCDLRARPMSSSFTGFNFSTR